MKNFSEILTFIAGLDGWLSSHEGYFLYKAAKETQGKGAIVEIGSWKGKSTICIAAGLGSLQVIAIDPHKGQYSKGKGLGKKSPTYKEFMSNLKTAGVKEKVTPLVATSEEAAKKWNKPIQLLFVDGLHDYKHTKQDYDLWSSFVVDSGVIALHDAFCGHRGPERVVLEDILPHGLYKEIGVVGSIIYARKGKPNSIEFLDFLRTKYLIQVALKLNKLDFPFKFFLIHRVIKLLLLNKYTYSILLQNR